MCRGFRVIVGAVGALLAAAGICWLIAKMWLIILVVGGIFAMAIAAWKTSLEPAESGKEVDETEEERYPRFLGGVLRLVPENHALVVRRVWFSSPKERERRFPGYKVKREGWRLLFPYVWHDVVALVDLRPVRLDSPPIHVNTADNQLVAVDFTRQTEVCPEDLHIMRYALRVSADGKGKVGRRARQKDLEDQIFSAEFNRATSGFAKDDPMSAKLGFQGKAKLTLNRITGLNHGQLDSLGDWVRDQANEDESLGSLCFYGVRATSVRVQKVIPPATTLNAAEHESAAEIELRIADKEAQAMQRIAEAVPEANKTAVTMAWILRDTIGALALGSKGKAPTTIQEEE